MPTAADIDDYIKRFPFDVRKTLRAVRKTIRKAAPTAKEAISYQIPAFTLNEKPLVYLAAFKNHIGLYPRKTAIMKFRKELAGYKLSKGTIQFPLGESMPLRLIARIVKFRVREEAERAKLRK